MAEWITYHSIVDTPGDWVDTANAIDNNIATLATREALGYTTMILDTPFASSLSNEITKVEHRLYGSLSDLGIPAKLKISPRYIAGDGTLVDVSQLLGWSNWIDITSDTNAPGTWAWSDIEALGVNVVYAWGSGPVPLAQVGVVQIKVTYTPNIVGKFSTSRSYYY